jgi:hypothetical protein
MQKLRRVNSKKEHERRTIMRSSNRSLFQLLWALPVMLILGMSSQAEAQGKSLKFEVTVTNITQNQIMSPAVVVSHRQGLAPIFQLGGEASSELAAVAEDADLGGLVAILGMDPHAIEVGTLFGEGGPILPGETASIVLDAGNGYRNNQISLVGMLVTTNDAFYGVNAAIPSHPSYSGTHGETETYFSPAYDAGSEYNSELCMYIPGPPCMVHAHDGINDPEGFVHIHPGIQGVGDLVVAETGWLNPVAKITVRLIRY